MNFVQKLGLHQVVCKYKETKESIKLLNSSICMQSVYQLINKNLGSQATLLGAQKDFVVVNRGEGVREIGKDKWWSELWKFWGGIWGQRLSMIY